MNGGQLPLADVTISAVQAEVIRAIAKHGLGKTLLNPAMPAVEKLAALVEELGEVARTLTYDQDHAGERVKELLQLGGLALAWAQCEDEAGGQDQVADQEAEAMLDLVAKDVLVMAVAGGMPDTYWDTDRRVIRARKVLGLTPDQARELGHRLMDEEVQA